MSAPETTFSFDTRSILALCEGLAPQEPKASPREAFTQLKSDQKIAIPAAEKNSCSFLDDGSDYFTRGLDVKIKALLAALSKSPDQEAKGLKAEIIEFAQGALMFEATLQEKSIDFVKDFFDRNCEDSGCPWYSARDRIERTIQLCSQLLLTPQSLQLNEKNWPQHKEFVSKIETEFLRAIFYLPWAINNHNLLNDYKAVLKILKTALNDIAPAQNDTINKGINEGIKKMEELVKITESQSKENDGLSALASGLGSLKPISMTF